MQSGDLQFIADVGGTNIRLAVVENKQIVRIEKYLCADFHSIDDAIKHFQREVGIEYFYAGCIAIACPVDKDIVTMTNHSWSFSKSTLQKELRLKKLFVINDYTAIAFSLPHLSEQQLIKVGGGEPVEKGNIGVFGPGTGLGVEHITWTSTGWKTLDGEGGHVDFAPIDEQGVIVWRYLQNKYGRASAEDVLSGRGIVNIYSALSEQQGTKSLYTEPHQVTQVGVARNDDTAYQAVMFYCRAMGSFAGNMALNLCTTGGVYIGGGITSKITEFFLQSDFRKAFESKGNFANYVKPIPTFLINEPDHGLLGTLAYLQQHLERRVDNG
ncbi:glucokinase [Agaribacter flavus]|uniref:Glucokinase n=1 Tax=Agaribacter flavus TaxID=1902781 RepID=A0ABV7FJM9_9ALTE